MTFVDYLVFAVASFRGSDTESRAESGNRGCSCVAVVTKSGSMGSRAPHVQTDLHVSCSNHVLVLILAPVGHKQL